MKKLELVLRFISLSLLGILVLSRIAIMLAGANTGFLGVLLKVSIFSLFSILVSFYLWIIIFDYNRRSTYRIRFIFYLATTFWVVFLSFMLYSGGWLLVTPTIIFYIALTSLTSLLIAVFITFRLNFQKKALLYAIGYFIIVVMVTVLPMVLINKP